MEVIEYVFVIFWAVVLLIDLAVTSFVFWNRDYSPYKAKQVPVIVLTMISGILWYPGILQGHKFLVDGVFSICPLWSIWSNLVFGLFLWIDCLAFRFWRLYYIYILKKNPKSQTVYLFIPAVWSLIVIIAIVGSIVDVFSEQCEMSNPYLASIVGVVILEFIFSLGLVFKLRHIEHRAFNEFKEYLYISVVAAIIIIAFTIIVFFELTLQIWGRLLTLSLVSFMFNLNFWVIMFVPLYKSFKDWDGYEKEFKDQFMQDSANAVQNRMKTKTNVPLSPSLQPITQD